MQRRQRSNISRVATIVLLTSGWSSLPAVSFDVTETIEGRAYVAEWDTIIVGSTLLRLAGIAVPETERGPHSLGGDAAIDALRHMIEGEVVTCSLTGGTTYGREVGNCTLNELNIAEELVRAGHALDCTRYSAGAFAAAQAEAVNAGLDLSGAFKLPWYCHPDPD